MLGGWYARFEVTQTLVTTYEGKQEKLYAVSMYNLHLFWYVEQSCVPEMKNYLFCFVSFEAGLQECRAYYQQKKESKR